MRKHTVELADARTASIPTATRIFNDERFWTVPINEIVDARLKLTTCAR
jgi:hypothetical protein